MKVLLFITVLAIATAFVSRVRADGVATPYPCGFTSYSREYPDVALRYYDLSNMWRDASKGQKDYTWTMTSDGTTFYVNVCGQTVTTACIGCFVSNQGVCSMDPRFGNYGFGDAAQTRWSEASFEGDPSSGTPPVYFVVINLTYGCSVNCAQQYRESYLEIHCDAAAGDGEIYYISQGSSKCADIRISMKSKWACPVYAPVPSPPASSHLKLYVGVGAVALVVFVLAVALAVMVYRRRHAAAEQEGLINVLRH